MDHSPTLASRVSSFRFSKRKFLIFAFPCLSQVWINSGDIILIGLRDFQDSKADVILKYLNDEARTLKSLGEIPETVNLEENNDIAFDANAAMPDMDAEDGDSDMPGSSDSSSSSEEESEEEEDEEEQLGLKNASRYKGEFSGDVNHWKGKKQKPRK
ncbi:unnamed protein product [Dibothriocephalus latus]|uniref:S1-like domain-containing protein n=1 Tax=Dibothriocephalus latus TaxID=60516 RepID=A0A3P7MAA1_DIBLA|nr:unnamed protein product [Dibothriocephalus latus]